MVMVFILWLGGQMLVGLQVTVPSAQLVWPLPPAAVGCAEAGIATATPMRAALVRVRRLLIFTLPPGRSHRPWAGRSWTTPHFWGPGRLSFRDPPAVFDLLPKASRIG